jgi:hypothetical protein
MFAYLDPGTGTVILQALVGGTAGLIVMFKMGGRRFLSFLPIIGKRFRDDLTLASDVAGADLDDSPSLDEGDETDLAALLDDSTDA